MIIQLTDKYYERRKAQGIQGSFWDPEQSAWCLDTTLYPNSVHLAVKAFPQLVHALPELPEAPTAFKPADIAEEWAGDTPADQLLPNTPDDIRSIMRRYQVVDTAYAVARIKNDGGAYIGWDRGLGKTLAAITVAHELGSSHIVIVTPNSSKATTWEPEIRKWGLPHEVYNFSGTPARRDRVVHEYVKSSSGVLLVHYESLRLLKNPDKLPVDLIIVDEAHRLAKGRSGPGAPAFYRGLLKLKARQTLCLSGSVILNSPEDLYGALHFMYRDRYKSIHRDWRDRFFIYVNNGYAQEFVGIKPDRLEALQKELAQFLLVRTKDTELKELPPREVIDHPVDLYPEQQRVYNELAESFLAELEGSEVVIASSVLGQLTKLRMVSVSTALVGDSPDAPSAKFDKCEELVNSIPGKVVVFTWHRESATLLADRLRKVTTVACITGDTRMGERAEIVGQFQSAEEPRVLIATIKTLGESVTLHAASDVIFLESSWVPADMEQAADRVRRIGQSDTVSVHHIHARNTVDDLRILPTLRSKEVVRRMIFGGTNA